MKLLLYRWIVSAETKSIYSIYFLSLCCIFWVWGRFGVVFTPAFGTLSTRSKPPWTHRSEHEVCWNAPPGVWTQDLLTMKQLCFTRDSKLTINSWHNRVTWTAKCKNVKLETWHNTWQIGYLISSCEIWWNATHIYTTATESH